MSDPLPCELCQRITKLGTTQHHLIPRTCHSNKWFRKTFSREEMSTTVDVCRDCHRAIHRLEPDEKQLGRNYNTIERLIAHPEISRYLTWIRKQK
jgi:hypothetical protein